MKQSVRSLAVEAKIAVREALATLRAAGFRVAKGRETLAAEELARAREALGLPSAEAPVAPEPPSDLGEDEMLDRLLGPLCTKGKLGPNHTTPIEHLYGHGIPDHQKGAARDRVEALLHDGYLAEKPSGGRRHVWLTTAGRKLLEQVRARA